MSRYYNDGDSGDLPAIFWQIDLQRALTSGRGQRLLRKFESALRSLPTRRLAGGAIVEMGLWDDAGDWQPVESVCAVGAFAAYSDVENGATWEQALHRLAELYDRDTDEWDTEALGRSYGLARTVAWYLGWLNDEKFGHLKPRQRWRAMLGWVRSEIREAA